MIVMNRVALVGIMVYDNECAKQINEILHDYSEYIIGRMGIPRVKDSLSVISVALDAPNDVISAISGTAGIFVFLVILISTGFLLPLSL